MCHLSILRCGWTFAVTEVAANVVIFNVIEAKVVNMCLSTKITTLIDQRLPHGNITDNKRWTKHICKIFVTKQVFKTKLKLLRKLVFSRENELYISYG